MAITDFRWLQIPIYTPLRNLIGQLNLKMKELEHALATASTGGGGGSVNSVTGNAPISITGTAADPVVNLAVPVTAAQGGTGHAGGYAAGDLLYAATATSLSKLPIGSAGQALTVNAGATAPEWSAASGLPAGADTLGLLHDGTTWTAARVPENTINLGEAGAVGDNSADDTAEIAAAIALSHSAGATTANRYGSRALYVPIGKQYIVTAPDANTSGVLLASLQNVYMFGHGGIGGGQSVGGYVPAKFKGRGTMKAVLDLHGVSWAVFRQLVLAGEELAGNSPTYGLLYHNESNSDPLGTSTRILLDSLGVGGDYLTAGFRLGSLSGNGLQADLATLVNCSAFGGSKSHATKWQNGYWFGEAAWANALNYTALGCNSVRHKRGILIERTNLCWLGGTTQSNDIDLFINTGLQGHSWVGGFRSEGSRMLHRHEGAASVFQALILEAITFQLEGSANDDIRQVPTIIDARTHLSWRAIRAGTMNPYTGTSAGGNTASTFKTVAGQLPTTNGGVAGWTVRIDHPGNAAHGQKRLILANDANGATSLGAWKGSNATWDVVPGAVTYVIEPVQNQYLHYFSVLENVGLANSPIKHAIHFVNGGTSTAILNGYYELDNGTNTVGWSSGGPIILAGTSTTRYVQPSVNFGIAEQDPDVRVMRGRAGTMATASGEMYELNVREMFAPECHAQTQGTTGATTVTYALVPKYPNPSGSGYIVGPIGTSITLTTANATLSETNYVRIHPKVLGSTPDLPAAPFYDVLKDDSGTWKLLIGNVPWYEFPVRDIGQPITTYSHSSTTTGGLKAKKFGLDTTPVARQTVTGSRGGNAALASLLSALATMGLITDSTTA